MPDQKPWYKRPSPLLIGIIVVVVALAAAAVIGLVVTQAAPAQPFAYRHAPHIANGVQCLFCHSGANRGQTAGLPTKSKCEGCHLNMSASTDGLKTVADQLANNDQLTWVPVAIQPDFVYFSHRPHVAFGVACESCHGNVGQMDAAEPVRGQNMGWCLNCHQQLSPENFPRLSDCQTCHK